MSHSDYDDDKYFVRRCVNCNNYLGSQSPYDICDTCRFLHQETNHLNGNIPLKGKEIL